MPDIRAPGGQRGDIIPKGYKAGQLAQYTPQQMQLHKQGFEHVSPESYLGRLSRGDEGIFNEIEAPALRDFSALQGNIASRFSGGGAGSLGSRRSSGFQNTMSKASQDFAGDLASRRQQLQRQALQDLMGFSDQLLNQRPYERFMMEKPPKKEGFNWQGLAGGAVGAAGGFFAGGPMGAVTGAKAGYDIGTGFHSGDFSSSIGSLGKAGLSAYGNQRADPSAGWKGAFQTNPG
jgi:hypothetical protein